MKKKIGKDGKGKQDADFLGNGSCFPWLICMHPSCLLLKKNNYNFMVHVAFKTQSKHRQVLSFL